MFNRFYQPDIDLDELEVRPSLDLSTSADLRRPLRWTALLSGKVHAAVATPGGVHRRAPLLGEDTVERLRAAGLRVDEIQDLIDRRAALAANTKAGVTPRLSALNAPAAPSFTCPVAAS